jgi:hypothetical protein
MNEFKPWIPEKIISKGEYNYAKIPNHPNATKNGYVLEHRMVMENKLGRLLTRKEVVHHENENKKDNNPGNLELKESHSQHTREHGYNKLKSFVKLKCPECKKIFIRAKNKTHLKTITKIHEYTTCSKKCRGKFSSKTQFNIISKQEYDTALKENIIEIFTENGPHDY